MRMFKQSISLFLVLASSAFPLFAQSLVIEAVYDPVAGPLISWEANAGQQYEVLVTTNVVSSGWRLAPAGPGAMEESRPLLAGGGTAIYHVPDGFGADPVQYFRVRESDNTGVTISIVAEDIVRDQLGVLAPFSWHMQLIWSPDAVASPLNPVHPFFPTEGEYVVLSQSMNELGEFANGGILGVVDSQKQSDIFEGGYLYVRVFNTNFNGGPPPTMYGQQPNIYGPVTRDAGIDVTKINNIYPEPFEISRPIVVP